MDQFRQVLETIRVYLGRMTPSQKLLIGSLSVIAVMTLFLVSQYTGRGGFVELMPDDPQMRLVSTLQAAGIEAESRNGQVVVPRGQQARAVAHLGQAGQLPGDTTILFNNLVERQDWRLSREQNNQQFVFALQNELARVIAQFRGVRTATVILDTPEPGALGRAVREPTASATVFTESGGPLSQEMVDAVAHLIAGARAGLHSRNVRVIDGSTGRQRTPSDEDDVVATNYLEHSKQVEREIQRKLSELLAHIPGVVVAVTAQVDVTRVNSQQRRNLPLNDGTVSLPRTTTESSLVESRAGRSAEPGVRSNQAADINFGGGGGETTLEQTEDHTEFQNAIGTELREVIDPRGMPTFLAASVNIPQGYVAELIRRTMPPEQAEQAIDEDTVRERFEAMRPQIEESLRPHLKGRTATGDVVDGEVLVSMVPVEIAGGPGPAQQAGLFGSFGGGSGGPLWAMGGGMFETIVVAGLAVVAVTMMIMMVRRSSRRVDLPSAEELVGMPRSLRAETDMVGEADEGDAPMAGIEVDEDDLKSRKMLEQVGEMVKENPDAAARLLRRWMAVED